MGSRSAGLAASWPPELFHLGGPTGAGINVMDPLFAKLDFRP